MKTRFLIIFLGLIFFIYLSSIEQFQIYAQEQNPNVRADDSPRPKDFQTGETLSNPLVVVIIQSLGAILIVLFIVIYAIKKKTHGASKHDNN